MKDLTGKIEDGRLVITNEKVYDPAKCPNIIFVGGHYHDGTCDCFDPECTEMAEWGYVWDKEKKHWDA